MFLSPLKIIVLRTPLFLILFGLSVDRSHYVSWCGIIYLCLLNLLSLPEGALPYLAHNLASNCRRICCRRFSPCEGEKGWPEIRLQLAGYFLLWYSRYFIESLYCIYENYPLFNCISCTNLLLIVLILFFSLQSSFLYMSPWLRRLGDHSPRL